MFLRIDFDVCKNCDTCEKILGGFKTCFKGKLFVSAVRYENDEGIRKSCALVMAKCPNNAIYME